MVKLNAIKRYIRQTFAFIEKDIFLELRVRAIIVTRFLNPVLQLIILIFVFNALFNVKKGYAIGYWDAYNYTLFLMIAFCVQFSRTIILKYKSVLIREKYWKTLSAIMVAPVNRFTLLFSTLISEFVLNSIPLIIIFVITLILYPIPLVYVILVLFIYFSIYLVFGAMGLIIGVFGISRESLVHYAQISINIILIFSCITYPKEIFPEVFQNFLLFNPLYYLFDLLRLTWYLGIDYNTAISLITPLHIINFILVSVFVPIISVYLFNRIYKKYGITGY